MIDMDEFKQVNDAFERIASRDVRGKLVLDARI